MRQEPDVCHRAVITKWGDIILKMRISINALQNYEQKAG